MRCFLQSICIVYSTVMYLIVLTMINFVCLFYVAPVIATTSGLNRGLRIYCTVLHSLIIIIMITFYINIDRIKCILILIMNVYNYLIGYISIQKCCYITKRQVSPANIDTSIIASARIDACKDLSSCQTFMKRVVSAYTSCQRRYSLRLRYTGQAL